VCVCVCVCERSKHREETHSARVVWDPKKIGFPNSRSNCDVCDVGNCCVFSPGTFKSMTEPVPVELEFHKT